MHVAQLPAAIPGRAISLNGNVLGMQPSATLAINERCRLLGEEGRDICRWGFGQSPFPVPDCVVQTLRENAHRKDYLPVAGLPELRQAVANYHARRNAGSFRAHDILIGPGSKELMFLLQIAYHGELVLPTPCWVSYGPQARIVGQSVSLLPTSYESGWRLTADDLHRSCQRRCDETRPRLLILNCPSNPTASSYGGDELMALADAARRWGIIVLSDEIYAELNYDGRPASISRYYPEGTIVSSGLSKWCGAGGWRLGTMAFPQELAWLREAVCTVASETYTAVSAPIQYAATAAFAPSQEIDDYLFHCRRILRMIGDWMARCFRELGLRVHPSTGAFYLFPDFESLRIPLARHGILGSREMCETLIERAGIGLLPGVHFERPREELTARCAFVDFDGGIALQHSRKVGSDCVLPEAFVAENCPTMTRGMVRLKDWVASLRTPAR